MNGKEKLDALLDSFIDNGIPGCGLSVNYKGKTIYTGYRGYASIEEKRKVDENTVYKVASCSKLLTATAVMKLYEEGKILLNDPVGDYLPFFKKMKYYTYDGSCETIAHDSTVPLTIKHLLTMTSGIPYMGKASTTEAEYTEKLGEILSPKMFSFTTMELAKIVSEIPLAFEPGKHWHYGLGYAVLGALIEAVSGVSFGEYLQREICGPLGMTTTSFECSEEMEKNLVNCYTFVDGKAVNITTPPEKTPTNGAKLEAGGAGIFSTLNDLAVFAGMWGNGGIWEGNRILSRNTIDLMRKDHLTGQPAEDFRKMTEQSYPWYKGYSWGLAGRTCINTQEAGSNGSVGEFGWCGAYGPYVLADPEKELGIAYVQETLPVIGGKQDYCHPRIRNAVYSILDEFE